MGVGGSAFSRIQFNCKRLRLQNGTGKSGPCPWFICTFELDAPEAAADAIMFPTMGVLSPSIRANIMNKSPIFHPTL
ncbi:hypothetical protein U1Q18_000826 [Sarracenia purpurea var. burkii]